MKTRFEHRFNELDLSKRQWELDISIDNILEQLEAYRIKNENLDFFEDFYYKNSLYYASCAPIDGTGSEWQDLENLLNKQNAGDIIEIWILTTNPKYFMIKCPNKDGLFPKKGAY